MDKVEIYVDGSYSNSKKNFSYGLVVLLNGKEIYNDYGLGTDPESAKLRNVAGEVMGAVKATEFAHSNGCKEITIYYDYQGIESWATGAWKRNKELTKQYHKYMQDRMKEMKINFVKVKGHSGVEYNELADQLAKKALGI